METSNHKDTAAVNSDQHSHQGPHAGQPASPAEAAAAEKPATAKRSPFMDVCLAAGMERFYDRGGGMQLSQRRMLELQQELAAHPEIALISDEAVTDIFWKEHAALQTTRLKDLRDLCEIVEKSAEIRNDAKIHTEQLKSIISYLTRTRYIRRPDVSIQITKKQLLGLYRTQKVVAKYMEIVHRMQQKKAGSSVLRGGSPGLSRGSTAAEEQSAHSGSLNGLLPALPKATSSKSALSPPTLSQTNATSLSAASQHSPRSRPSPEQSASTATTTPPPLITPTSSNPLSPLTTAQSLPSSKPTAPPAAAPSPTSSLINSSLTVFSASNNAPSPDWDMSHPRPHAVPNQPLHPSPRLKPLPVPGRSPQVRSPWQDMNLNLARSMTNGHSVARPSMPRPMPHAPASYGVACSAEELERRSAALRASPFATMMGRYKRTGEDVDAATNEIPIPARAWSAVNMPHYDMHLGSPSDSMLDDLLPSDIWPQLSVSPTEAHLGDHLLSSLANAPADITAAPLQSLSSGNYTPHPPTHPHPHAHPTPSTLHPPPHSTPNPTPSTPLQMLPSDKCLNLASDLAAAPSNTPHANAPSQKHPEGAIPGMGLSAADSAAMHEEIADGRRSVGDSEYGGYHDLNLDDDFGLLHSSTSLGKQFAGCGPKGGDKDTDGCMTMSLDSQGMQPSNWMRHEMNSIGTRRRSSFEFEFMYGRVAVDPEFAGVSPFEAMPDPRLAWDPSIPGGPYPPYRHRPHTGKQRMPMMKPRKAPYPIHPRNLPPPGHPAWAAYAEMETDPLSPHAMGHDWKMPGV